MCPPQCSDDEFFCPGTVQSDGCRGQSLCVEKKLDINGIVCPEICPVACSDRELRVHQGSDPRGCLLEDKCVPNDCYSFDVDILSDSVNHCEAADSAQDCQHQCQHEEHCKEFVFITNANEKDQNCCHVESRTEGNEQTVAGFVSGPRFCGNETDEYHYLDHHDHDQEHQHENENVESAPEESPAAPEEAPAEPESPEAAPAEPENPAPEEPAA